MSKSHHLFQASALDKLKESTKKLQDQYNTYAGSVLDVRLEIAALQAEHKNNHSIPNLETAEKIKILNEKLHSLASLEPSQVTLKKIIDEQISQIKQANKQLYDNTYADSPSMMLSDAELSRRK